MHLTKHDHHARITLPKKGPNRQINFNMTRRNEMAGSL